jgi:hypothetical protein
MELVSEELTAKFAMEFGALRLSCDVNCLVNYLDPNCSVNFAENSNESHRTSPVNRRVP